MANEDKRKPIEERIAALMGKTSYCDIREGFGGSARGLSDQDVAAALGLVVKAQGSLAVKVLETHYGSTLIHLEALLRAWDEHEHVKGATREHVALTRFGGELAIRELASIRYGTPQLAHYAYLLQSRRESLQQRRDDAGRWLHNLRDNALLELRRCMRDGRENDTPKKIKAVA